MASHAPSRQAATAHGARGLLTHALWLSLLIATLGCGQGPLPPPAPLTVTRARPIGSWAGRTDYRTDDFYSGYGRFRVHWETRALEGDSAPYFELKLQSFVSGRQLGESVERFASDSGVLTFEEDPRDFHFAVRARNMEWAFRVEELIDRPELPSAAAALGYGPLSMR